jgi:hypothetical protein
VTDARCRSSCQIALTWHFGGWIRSKESASCMARLLSARMRSWWSVPSGSKSFSPRRGMVGCSDLRRFRHVSPMLHTKIYRRNAVYNMSRRAALVLSFHNSLGICTLRIRRGRANLLFRLISPAHQSLDGRLGGYPRLHSPSSPCCGQTSQTKTVIIGSPEIFGKDPGFQILLLSTFKNTTQI